MLWDMCDMTLLYCNIETNKAANTFLKRVTKEIMIINMKVEDKDVHVHLYTWLELQYVRSSHQLKIVLTIQAAI